MSQPLLSKALQRESYIDICKAIGIILVVFGHTYTIPECLLSTIYSFHMPMFFMLSGLLYNREKNNNLGFSQFTLKKVKSLLIPYFIFAFSNFMLEIMWRLFVSNATLDTDYFVTRIKGIFLCYSNTENMPNCSPIWFLLCLFIAELLFWWVMKLPLKLTWIPAIFGIIINYVVLPTENSFTAYPFKFPTFLVALFFIYIGYCLRCVFHKQYAFMNNRLLMLIVSTIVMVTGLAIVILTDSNIKTDMNGNTYDNYFIFLLTSVPISAAFILFFKQLPAIGNPFFLWLGKNTLYIIGFNFVCRDIATELYYYIPVIKNFPMHWSVNFVMTFALCCLSVIICIKIKSLFFKIFSNRTK